MPKMNEIKIKAILTGTLLVFLAILLPAQEFDVREFKADPQDLAARRFEKRTVNDDPSAIIKILTNIKGLKFESPMGIVDVEMKEEGYWLWVGPRERSIRLMADGYLPLDVPLPEPARPLMVYQLIVSTKGLAPALTNLAKVTFRVNENNVFIRLGESAPVETTTRAPFYNVPKGSHTFRFFKQGFQEKELTLVVEDDMIIDVELVPGVSTTRLALSGWIIIESEPPGADVFLNEQRVGVTPYQRSHIAGKYSVMLQYPLYQDHVQTFELNEGATLNMPLIRLLPRFGNWQVRSNPPGAEVFLNGKLEGVTPLSKAAIGSGRHEMVLRLPLFHEYKESIEIKDGEEKSYDVDLKPAFGELVINSEPQGAKVFIDGREVGSTPFVNSRQPSGSFSIRVEKELYADGRDQAEVKDGEKTERFISLTQNFGNLQINADNSDIFIDGARVAFGKHNSNLKPGRYRIKASQPGHEDDEREVFITIGRLEVIALNPKPRLGALSISTNPFETRGAEIFINGKLHPQNTPATIPLVIGSYEVTIRKTGYLESTHKVDIREGQEQQLAVTLQTFSGSLQSQARKHKNMKILYGAGSLAAIATGGYFLYSANTLAQNYLTATTNATQTYNTMEQHFLYSYFSFGAAVPLTLMTIIKAAQQNKTTRKISMTAVPMGKGALVSVKLQIGDK